MAQLQAGTVTVTNGTARVIGDANANWANAVVGNWFSLVFSPTPTPNIYQIATLTAPTSSSSGFWELTVVGNINEPSLTSGAHAGLAYTIHIDFVTCTVGGTTNYFPVFHAGDVQTAEILSRFMSVLAQAIAASGAGGGATAGNSYQAVTVAAAGNTNSTATTSDHHARITANAGTGAYTATFCCLRAGRNAGDSMSLHFDFAASINPRIQVFDDTTAGTLLLDYQNDGTATIEWAYFTYTGAAWYLEAAGFIR
jgi:hypothetical protein